MDGPNQDFGNKPQEFHDNFNLRPGQDDSNIDPLLNDCPPNGAMPPNVSNPMDSQLFMNSAMWNPALNNPVGFFPPGVSGTAPTTLTTNPLQPNSPIQPLLDTQSSPRTPSSEPLFGTSRTSSKSSVPSFNSADADAKPRRSSRAAIKAQPQPAAVETTKPPGRRRASKAPSIKEEEEEDGDEEDAGLDDSTKRNKFLKRNRIAASKCRQKKKEWVSSLEDTRYGLEHENNVLHKQYNGLVDELSTIKNQLMQHASCNDANINQWLDNEARKFVQRIASQNQAQAQPHKNTGDCCDKHRRSSSVATSIPRSIDSEINYDHMPDSMIQSGP